MTNTPIPNPEGTDAFGLFIPSALPSIDDRQIALLMMLGRLELMTTPQIKRMLYAEHSISTLRRDLAQLHDDELIWQALAPIESINAKRQPKTAPSPLRKLPHLYGLTTKGKTLLETLEVEADGRSLDALKARDLRSRRPGAANLSHDLQVSWWCSSLLLELQRNRFCHSVFVQVEFVIHKSQRIDALVVARFHPTSPRPIDTLGRMPWFQGVPLRPGESEIRLALEVDKGTESLPILLEKAVAYRDLTAQGVYNAAFGGPVLPIFIVPTARRASQIATEWRHAWPEGWGVITTAKGASHPTHGTLWGDYRSMRDGKPFALLTALHVERSAVEFRQLFTLERWQQGVITEANNLKTDSHSSQNGG